MFQNDNPIKTKGEDLLSRATFSERFGEALLDWNDATSLVIALYGSWGSGKSSIINLAIEYLEDKHKASKNDKKPIIFYFNPWNFTEQNQLITIFFKELAKSINYYDKSEDAKRVGNELLAYSKFFDPLALIPPATPFALLFKNLFGSFGEAVKAWGELKTKTLDQYKADLDKHMSKLNRKVVIVIDDIDRLNPDEIKQVFQMVKLNASFPNMLYILPFDQEKISEVLTEEKFSGRDYLEKIVQVPFQVPVVEQVKLDRMFYDEVNKMIKPLPQKYWDEKYFMNIYYGGLREYFTSVRQIKRFANSLHFNSGHIPKELNPADVITLETVRVFSPEMYEQIWKNKELFTETESGLSSRNRDNEIRKQKLDAIFEKLDPQYKNITQKVVLSLFPQLAIVYGNTSFGSDWQDRWNKERKVCATDRFDKYFMFSIPEEEVSQDEIDVIIRNSKNTAKTEKTLVKLTKGRKLRSFLEKLSLYLDDVPTENVEPFVLALFNISDQLPRDRVGMAFLDTESWCIRFGYHMLLKIKDLEKRKQIFLRLLKKTRSLHIPAKLVSIEVRERKGDSDKSEPLIAKDDLQTFSEVILDKIRRFAKSDKLLGTPNLLYTLFFWRDLISIEEPKKYVENLIKTNSGVVKLVESVMYQSSSQTLDEHVSTTTWQIDPNNIKTFTDIDTLKVKVEKMPNKAISKLTERQQLGLKLFLESFNVNMNSFFRDIANE